MNAFLAEANTVFQNLIINPYHYNNLKVVLCNESCDLDSVISCLVYAFALYHEGIFDYHAKSVVIPLLNISQEDFRLRTEVIYFLEQNKIILENVPTRGVQGLLDLPKIQDAGELDLYLVDHHVLHSFDEILKSSVVEVIDHRPRDPNWLWENISNVTIENVGSCATLVAKKIKERDAHLMTKEIAALLLGPIITDTSNLSGNSSPLDEEMVAYLEKISPIDRKELLKNILKVKFDMTNFTTIQVFKKDLKIISGIPTPSIPMLINDLRNRQNFVEDLTAFSKMYNSPLVILLGKSSTGQKLRDVGIFGKNSEKLVSLFLSNDVVDLKLEEIVDHGVAFFRLFQQGNTKATRKLIVPIITKASRN